MKTKIHIHGGSREYTLDGANTFTLMKHKLLRREMAQAANSPVFGSSAKVLRQSARNF